jgi:hypothetical protein
MSTYIVCLLYSGSSNFDSYISHWSIPVLTQTTAVRGKQQHTGYVRVPAGYIVAGEILTITNQLSDTGTY